MFTPKRVKNLDRLLSAVLDGSQSLESALQDPACQRDAELSRLLVEEVGLVRHIKAQSFSSIPLPQSVLAGRKRLEAQINRQRSDWGRVFDRSRLAWNAGLVVLVLLFALASTRIVWQGKRALMIAMPGDTVYFLKVANEQIRLDMASSPEDEIRLYLEFAQNRAIEFESLMLEERFNLLPQTLAGLESALGRAHSLQDQVSGDLPYDIQISMVRLEQTVERQIILLQYFGTPLASELRPEIERVAWLAFNNYDRIPYP